MPTKTTAFPSEHAVIKGLTSFLANEGYRVRHEVPNMGQSADVAATKNRWLTIIEAKRHDWRNAFRQCVAHELVADFVCIAIATKSVSKNLFELANARGYGLIHCDPLDGRCNWVVSPRRNEKIWRPERRRFISDMRSIQYEY